MSPFIFSLVYGHDPIEVGDARLADALHHVRFLMDGKLGEAGSWSTVEYYPGLWECFRDKDGELHLIAIAGRD